MNPEDARDDDERFTALLASYSEALAAGREVDPASDPAVPAEMRLRLERTLAVLRRLRQCRPWLQPPTLPYEESGTGTVVLSSAITFHDGVAGGQVGRFRILRALGGGGGGIVFLAFDPELRREVAVKVPRLEALLTPELRQRFLREARAAAALNHPNLVPVYEPGEANGLCFIVSAYCPGGNLAEWLAQRTTPVPVRLAAEVMAVLADAVQYVHERGIYHRDIKPSNVLLDRRDAGPTDSASQRVDLVPRLTDFGLAKVLDGVADLTRSGALLGTPSYMAPEQAEGRLSDIGPPTDVYGLGAVLYELLTRRPPFRGLLDADTMRQVLADEPARPNRLRPDVPRDLETICLKCLEKQPGRRYVSAAALAGDLRRFLAHEPILARRSGWLDSLVRWARRHPAGTILAVFALLVAASLLAGGIWLHRLRQSHDAELGIAEEHDRQQEEEIQRHREQAQGERRHRQNLYADSIHLAGESCRAGRLDEASKQLTPHRLSAASSDSEDLRGFEWYFLARQAQPRHRLIRHSASLYCVAFSADGRTCATGSYDGTIRLWDPATGQLRGTLTGHTLPIFTVAYSPDGKYLASGGGIRETGVVRGELFLWDAVTLKRLRALPGRLGAVDSVAFSPDGRTLAAAISVKEASGGETRLWALPSGTPQAIPFANIVPLAVTFSQDGRSLLVGCSDGHLSRCDPVSGRILDTWSGHRGAVWSLASSPGGLLATGSHDGTVRLWRPGRPGEQSLAEYGHPSDVWGVAFSRDGKTLASICRRGVIKLWDVDARQEKIVFQCEETKYGRAVAFAPDSKSLAVVHDDGKLWICAVPRRSPEALSWLGHRQGPEPREAWSVAFSPDGKTLASAGDDHAVRLWNPVTGETTRLLSGHGSLVSCLGYSPDSRLLASGSYDGSVRLWNTTDGRELARLPHPLDSLRCLAFSPDGTLLATGSKDETVRLWNVRSRRELTLPEARRDARVYGLAFSPDGRHLVAVCNNGSLNLWQMDPKKFCGSFSSPSATKGINGVSFSPKGELIAVACGDGTIRLWQPTPWRETAILGSHGGTARAVAFAADGLTLASAGDDALVRLWHVVSRKELLTVDGDQTRINSVAFAPNGRVLAAARHDGTLKIWRGEQGR